MRYDRFVAAKMSDLSSSKIVKKMIKNNNLKNLSNVKN
jgi:hypothetical protein